MTFVSLFVNLIDKPDLVLIFILIFFMSFQATSGSFFFTYVAEIAQDSGVSLANFTIFSFILMFAYITNSLIDGLGSGYTFMLFAIFNLAATVLMLFLLKDISGLSKEEIKTLYSSKNNG